MDGPRAEDRARNERLEEGEQKFGVRRSRLRHSKRDRKPLKNPIFDKNSIWGFLVVRIFAIYLIG